MSRYFFTGKRFNGVFKRMSSSFTNALANEKSPYLLRHKHNLVDWKPWGDDAFRLAKSLNRPIFLSVGYSTCHWCYVMERESFENELIAKFMNEHFVSILVDREERPDVDTYYMNFVRNISNSAGWPMSVFMDYHATPFMGGSYFPPFSQDGRTGFAALLKLIANTWADEPTLLRSQGKAMMDALVPVHIHAKDSSIPDNEELVTTTVNKYADQFDYEFGGLKSHSKFSRAPILSLFNVLIGRSGSESDLKAKLITMVDKTLKAMSTGGIRDHIEGGFHRYTVDQKWIVPHFEKMLYDQGQLLNVFAEFSMMSQGRYNFVLQEVISYLNLRLRHEEGGFYTAEDAVSHIKMEDEKEVEGAFYVWDYSEVVEALKNSAGLGGFTATELFCTYFNIKEEGNTGHFQDTSHDLYRKNVLYMIHTHSQIASELGVCSDALKESIESYKVILSKIRETRPHPFVDSKFLTDYQGHVLSGLAKAYQTLQCERTLLLAEKCADFCKNFLEVGDGALRHCAFKSQDDSIEFSANDIGGFSQDYAYYIQGLLDLYTVNGNEDLLLRAKKLQLVMIEKLWDETENEYGFYMCEDSAIKLRNGLRSEGDGVEPAPSAIAASNLLRLSAIFHDDSFKEYAEKLFQGVGRILAIEPLISPTFLIPILRLKEITKIVISGSHDDPTVVDFRKVINANYIWNASVIHLDDTSVLCDSSMILSEIAKDRTPAVHICFNESCGLPIRTVEDLEEAIKKIAGSVDQSQLEA